MQVKIHNRYTQFKIICDNALIDLTILLFDITNAYCRKISSYLYDTKFKPDVAVKVDLLALSDSNNHRFGFSTNSGKFDVSSKLEC